MGVFGQGDRIYRAHGCGRLSWPLTKCQVRGMSITVRWRGYLSGSVAAPRPLARTCPRVVAGGGVGAREKSRPRRACRTRLERRARRNREGPSNNPAPQVPSRRDAENHRCRRGRAAAIAVRDTAAAAVMYQYPERLPRRDTPGKPLPGSGCAVAGPGPHPGTRPAARPSEICGTIDAACVPRARRSPSSRATGAAAKRGIATSVRLPAPQLECLP